MLRDSRVNLLVALAVTAAVAAMLVSYPVAPPFPGYWDLGGFVLIAFLLDRTGLPLRVSARSSVSFIMHISCAILFGAFWGGVTAGVSVGLNHLVSGTPRNKTVFNVAQRVLSVVLALLVYRALGGAVPPSYLGLGSAIP